VVANDLCYVYSDIKIKLHETVASESSALVGVGGILWRPHNSLLRLHYKCLPIQIFVLFGCRLFQSIRWREMEMAGTEKSKSFPQ